LNILIVGKGFAGKLHEEAWKKLGYCKVYFYDITFGVSFKDALESIKPDIIDFCDTPKSRIDYLINHYNEFEDKVVFVEKPPCRPVDLEKYKNLCKHLDIIPVHNYIYLVNECPREVVILRNGPHKGWYIDPELAGGGILLDHGYHWLYVADFYGIDLNKLKGWVDGFPDRECVIVGDDFKLYATWKSPIRLTVVNGKITEFRTKEKLINSFMEIFKLIEDENRKRELRDQSLRVMEFIKEVYEDVRFCARSEA